MTTLPITDKQKQLINNLYKFRYLTINHFQKLLNHKSQFRIKQWLEDLENKGYIFAIKSKDRTEPFIYCLDTKAKYLLMENKNADPVFLNRLYKEKTNKRPFIDHHLFIATAYLFFKEKNGEDSELKFFTQQELKGYRYFPNPLPDAYISIKSEKKTKRYFLDLFDPNIPPFVPRNRIKYYLQYFQDGQWQENTKDSPYPSILFLCPTENLKRHIFMYGKSVLQRSFSEMKLFVTTTEKIHWERIE